MCHHPGFTPLLCPIMTFLAQWRIFCSKKRLSNTDTKASYHRTQVIPVFNICKCSQKIGAHFYKIIVLHFFSLLSISSTDVIFQASWLTNDFSQIWQKTKLTLQYISVQNWTSLKKQLKFTKAKSYSKHVSFLVKMLKSSPRTLQLLYIQEYR